MTFHRGSTASTCLCLLYPTFVLLILCQSSAILSLQTEDNLQEDVHQDQDLHNSQVAENRLALQLYAIIEHYKNEDPIGFPGAPIPDPMSVPDIKKSLGVATLNMMKIQAFGLSKFRIASINVNLEAMKVDGVIVLEELRTSGTYTLNSLFARSSGPFKVILKKVTAKASASLGVAVQGNLVIERIRMDISFADMTMDFQNLGFLGSLFQGFVNTAPTVVFDAIKPFILQEADKQFRAEINEAIEKLLGGRLLPNSITPLDMAIAEGRKRVREMGYDPFHLPNYNHTVGIITAQLSNTWIYGIASFYRVGEVVVVMEDNVVTLKVHIGSQEITGASQWEIGWGLITRFGQVQFSVHHIHLMLNVSQPLDLRKKPQINDLQIDLGNIQVRCDGAGTLDYTLEFVINVLPNLLRYQIVNALENPIRARIQEHFNTINMEQLIKENFAKFQANQAAFDLDFKFF